MFNVWNSPNVNRRVKTMDTARYLDGIILLVDRALERDVSIDRPTASRTAGDAVHAYLGYGMATEVLGDAAHRPFNLADVSAA